MFRQLEHVSQVKTFSANGVIILVHWQRLICQLNSDVIGCKTPKVKKWSSQWKYNIREIAEKEAWKKTESSNGIWTRDICNTGAILWSHILGATQDSRPVKFVRCNSQWSVSIHRSSVKWSPFVHFVCIMNIFCLIVFPVRCWNTRLDT